MTEINVQKAEFLLSAPKLSLCPPESGAEVAFAGRSNAGKSSAINAFTGRQSLARTSKTPGRTQLLNFFSLGTPQARLVDLPGYGYAKVPKKVKAQWEHSLTEYLFERETLTGLVLVMDIRRPFQPSDTPLIDWAVEAELPVHLLLTKADKLKRGAVAATMIDARKHIVDAGVASQVSLQAFSALKKQGIDELTAVVTKWLAAPSPEKTVL